MAPPPAVLADSSSPAADPVAQLSQRERLWLFQAMAHSRVARRRLAKQRRSARTPALDGAAADGWEALEAAAMRALQEGDSLFASAGWPLPLAGAARIGPAWRLVDVVSAAAGAAMTTAPGSVAIAICEAPALRDAVPALATVARRHLPLVVLAADRDGGGDARAAADAASVPFELVRAIAVETVVLATASACANARAGHGPTLIACRPAEGGGEATPEHEADPIEVYAHRLRESGASLDDLRAVVRSTRGRP